MRRPVCLLAGLALALSLDSGPALQGAQPDPGKKTQGEPLILGPFLLGDLYHNMPDQTLSDAPFRHLRELISGAAGPAHKEVVKALNQCKLYVIARTAQAPGKRAKEFVGWTAKIVVEGALSFDLKDQKGRRFRIHLKKVSLSKGVINVSQDPHYWETNVVVQLRVDRVSAKPEPLFSDLMFGSRAFSFDVNGKVEWDKE
jgi:hypothetical protein